MVRALCHPDHYTDEQTAQWGGLVSSGMYKTGDLMQDFGNGCYSGSPNTNDGWDATKFSKMTIISTLVTSFMLRASLPVSIWSSGMARLGSTTIRNMSNFSSVMWVMSHILPAHVDHAKAAGTADRHFPFSRAFDWFHGHSWAKGLFESADGKDQESTSEDAYFSYSLKLWGIVTGDQALEGRGNLMLAIQRRVFRNYFLMDRDNRNQPEKFIENRVTGIVRLQAAMARIH